MPYYPTSATGLNYASSPNSATPGGVAVASSGSNNTKGSYVEFFASTAFAANAIGLAAPAANTGGINYLFDVALGAGGAEVVLLPNLMSGGDGTSSTGAYFGTLPCAIPSSTRVSARSQCTTGGNNVNLAILLIAAGGAPGISTWTTYGVNTSTTRGSVVDPGGSVNTKGAYTQITASTSAVTQWLTLMNSFGGNAAPALARWVMDLATGAGGAEVILIPAQQFIGTTSPTVLNPNARGFLTYIAASTRLAIRASSSNNDATDRLIDCAVLAGTAPVEDTGIVASPIIPAIFANPMAVGY